MQLNIYPDNLIICQRGFYPVKTLGAIKHCGATQRKMTESG